MSSLVENYTTKIAAARTAGQIQELLARHGVETIVVEYRDGQPVGVAFSMKTELGPRPYRLPVDVDAMHALLRAEKCAGRLPGISRAMADDRDHAARVAWRVVAEWLAAQLTLVASSMVTLDQVMLPYLMVEGRTLYDRYREQGLRELTDGQPG